jgi:LuxR family transcriptional activator of bioluminescence operon
MRGENCLDHWQALQYELFVVGYYYYSYLQPLLLKNQTPVEKFDLSQREIQCLILIAKQYPVKLIAENLHITERTVNYHIQRLNKKLGVKNKYQAVAKALQYKLFV